MPDNESPRVWRRAVPADAEALTERERAANLVALAHVFVPAEHPFPFADVLARWRRLLADPEVTVETVDANHRVECLVAYDAMTLRHLAVHPDRWGSGLGGAAVARAVAAIGARGGSPRLWCLRDNHRARAFYERLGWWLTGRSRTAEWPPYPVEVELAAKVRGSSA